MSAAVAAAPAAIRDWTAALVAVVSTQSTPSAAERLSALPQSLAQSDRAKPAGVVECDARRVLGEDAGLHRPDAGRLGAPGELREQRPADAAAARPFGHVDAVLGYPVVRAAVGDRRQHRPALYGVCLQRDQQVTGQVAGLELLPARGLGLE